MKKITSLIASFLLLFGMSANAQMVTPTLENGKLMTAEELNQSKGVKRIAIQLIHQAASDKGDWFYPAGNTGTSHNTMDNANFGEQVVFEWIEKDGLHILKKVTENQFIQQSKACDLGAEATAQLIKAVTPDPQSKTGLTATGWDTSCPKAEDPNNKFVCRFVKNGTETWINSNNKDWNNGKGVWTMFYVYDLTGHVVFNEISGDAITGLEAGAKVTTFCAPFATNLPEGVKAYNVKEALANASTVQMEEVTGGIPANQGVILVSKNANAIMPVATAEVAPYASVLKGAASAPATMGENDYVLATDGGVTQFYKAINASVLNLNKAYLQLPAAAAASLKMNFGGEATGIEAVEAENADAPVYDLSGRRVNHLVKGGIYIQNGKKFVK